MGHVSCRINPHARSWTCIVRQQNLMPNGTFFSSDAGGDSQRAGNPWFPARCRSIRHRRPERAPADAAHCRSRRSRRPTVSVRRPTVGGRRSDGRWSVVSGQTVGGQTVVVPRAGVAAGEAPLATSRRRRYRCRWRCRWRPLRSDTRTDPARWPRQRRRLRRPGCSCAFCAFPPFFFFFFFKRRKY